MKGGMGWLVVAALGACAVTAPKPRRPDGFVVLLPERAALLPNRVRLVMLPDHSTDLVEVDVRYDVGAKDDPPGKEGLAHLVEHLMFQQRPEGPDKPPIAFALQRIAIHTNAYTTHDSTHYESLARKENVGELVALEAARLGAGCAIDVADFEREREVVRNEMRWRAGSAVTDVMDALRESIYPESHPYRRRPGGTDATIAALTLEDVCQFLRDHYAPHRATVVIAGNFSVADMKQIAAPLAAIPDRETRPPRAVEVPAGPTQRVRRTLAVRERILFVSWPMPPSYGAHGVVYPFVAWTLVGQLERLDKKHDFAQDITASVIGGPHAPALVVAIILEPGASPDRALERVGQARKYAAASLDGVDFRKLHALLKGDFAMALEPLSARTDHFADLVQFTTRDGFGKRLFSQSLAQWERVSSDSIKLIMRDDVTMDRARVLVVDPGKPRSTRDRAPIRFDGAPPREDFASIVDPQAADAPVAVPDRTGHGGVTHRFQLDNGLRVIVTRRGEAFPIVSAALVVRAGTAHEPAGKDGVAQLAYRTLLSVRPNRWQQLIESAQAFADDEANEGVSVDRTVFFDKELNIYLDALLDRLAARKADSKLVDKWVEGRRRAMVRRWGRSGERARARFTLLRATAVYGPAHAYATTGHETPHTIENVSRDDVIAFQDRYYVGANTTLILAGNVDAQEAERLIRERFGKWPKGTPASPIDAPAAERSAPTYFGLASNDEPDTVILSIQYAGARGTEDLAARMLLAEMFDIRAQALRDRLGASYAVGGSLSIHVGPSVFTLWGQVDAARAGEGLAALRAEVDALRAGDGFAGTFVFARQRVLERLLAGATDSGMLCRQLGTYAVFELPHDFQDRLIAEVASARPDVVHRLIERDLTPAREVVGAAGTRDVLERMFKEAGIDGAKLVE